MPPICFVTSASSARIRPRVEAGRRLNVLEGVDTARDLLLAPRTASASRFIVSSSRAVRTARAWNRSSECEIRLRIAWSCERSDRILARISSLSPPAVRQTSARDLVHQRVRRVLDRSKPLVELAPGSSPGTLPISGLGALGGRGSEARRGGHGRGRFGFPGEQAAPAYPVGLRRGGKGPAAYRRSHSGAGAARPQEHRRGRMQHHAHPGTRSERIGFGPAGSSPGPPSGTRRRRSGRPRGAPGSTPAFR